MSTRKGLLLRVGIDQTAGYLNAPINPETNDYFYLPIKHEDDPPLNGRFKPGMATTYQQAVPRLNEWCARNSCNMALPSHLLSSDCHLDPDFEHLTYGDQSTGRGWQIEKLMEGDFIIFYASFRPVSTASTNLIYAIYGIMFVKQRARVGELTPNQYCMNAHTRIAFHNNDDWVIFANPVNSGRFSRAIPIGEYRNRAYRVKNDLLDKWDGLGIKDGYIQRSVNPPWFSNPDRFLNWLYSQKLQLLRNNW